MSIIDFEHKRGRNGRAARLAVVATLAVALGGMALATTPAAGKELHNTIITYKHHFLFIKWGRDEEDWSFNFEPLPLDTSYFPTMGTTFTEVTREESGETTSCHSEGAIEGEVKTAPLSIALGYINKKTKEVGYEAYPTGGGLYASFTCGDTVVEWKGGLVYALTPVNKVIKEGSALSIKTAPSAKLEDLPKGVEPTKPMEAQENGGGFHAEEFVDEGEIKPEGGTTVEVKAKGKKPPEFVFNRKKEKKGK